MTSSYPVVIREKGLVRRRSCTLYVGVYCVPADQSNLNVVYYCLFNNKCRSAKPVAPCAKTSHQRQQTPRETPPRYRYELKWDLKTYIVPGKKNCTYLLGKFYLTLGTTSDTYLISGPTFDAYLSLGTTSDTYLSFT